MSQQWPSAAATAQPLMKIIGQGWYCFQSWYVFAILLVLPSLVSLPRLELKAAYVYNVMSQCCSVDNWYVFQYHSYCWGSWWRGLNHIVNLKHQNACKHAYTDACYIFDSLGAYLANSGNITNNGIITNNCIITNCWCVLPILVSLPMLVCITHVGTIGNLWYHCHYWYHSD